MCGSLCLRRGCCVVVGWGSGVRGLLCCVAGPYQLLPGSELFPVACCRCSPTCLLLACTAADDDPTRQPSRCACGSFRGRASRLNERIFAPPAFFAPVYLPLFPRPGQTCCNQRQMRPFSRLLLPLHHFISTCQGRGGSSCPADDMGSFESAAVLEEAPPSRWDSWIKYSVNMVSCWGSIAGEGWRARDSRTAKPQRATKNLGYFEPHTSIPATISQAITQAHPSNLPAPCYAFIVSEGTQEEQKWRLLPP